MSDMKENLELLSRSMYRLPVAELTDEQLHAVVARAVLARLQPAWQGSLQAHCAGRRAYYFSAEYLLGKAVYNNLLCTGLTGEYSLVLLLEGDSPVPTDGNIQYIDQMSIANGAVKFTLKPKALKVGTYNIYISTTDEALKKVASFKYGEKPLIELGDANNDGKVDTNDATAILLYVVNKYTMTDEQLMAADVNGDHTVNTNDAVAILLQIVGK